MQFHKLVAVNEHDCARVCQWCIQICCVWSYNYLLNVNLVWNSGTVKSTEALSTPLFVDLIHQCRTVNNKFTKTPSWENSFEIGRPDTLVRHCHRVAHTGRTDPCEEQISPLPECRRALTVVLHYQNTVSVKCPATDLFTQHCIIIYTGILKLNYSVFSRRKRCISQYTP